MSVYAISWVLSLRMRSAGFTHTDKLLLMVLADQADENGFTWVGGNTLCRIVEVNRSTLSRHAQRMEGRLVHRFTRRRPNGSQSSNLWMLDMGRSEAGVIDEVLEVLRGHKDPVDGVVHPLCSLHRGGVQPRTGDICTAVHTPDPSVYPEKPAPQGGTVVPFVQPTVALYVDTLTERGVKQHPKSLPARVGKEVKKLLEEGMDLHLVQAAVKVAAQRNLTPTAIPYLAMEVQAPARKNGNGRYGRGVTTEMIKEARRLLREQG